VSTVTETPLLRELIDIPKQVSAGDLVTELASAVNEAQETVDLYVVTPQLKQAFDQALGIVALSASDGDSRAAFLHGSFGAGKSHFMAMLHLVLQGDPHARAKPELQDVVHKHDPALQGRKWLLVPYHMLGKTSLEQGVLGGYAAYVKKLHPDAPEPAVFRDQELFANARELRASMDDDRFFAALGKDDAGFGRFGGAAWDAASFEAAMQAPPGDPQRTRLQSALLETLLSSVRGAGGGDASLYVEIDDGLAVITEHAKALGYDGLVLFLDELILWLASNLNNEEFVAREASKIPKLRESGNASRALPIVSFVARQRDLREFVGRDAPGAQQAAFADTLDYGEGRFEVIPLEDQNLPEIARQRVLRARDDEATRAIDDAFATVAKQTTNQRSTLLTSTGTIEQFRATYPFTPALMQVLVALSSALQRNRTALKVLKQLLSRRRDELRLGDIVGVGEIWDVVLESPEPFSAALAAQADQARRLYREKLRPMLLQEQGLDETTARDLPWSHPFRANDRLLKTLLIAALVPHAEPVRELTVSRVAALNHGSVRTRIAGNETAQLLQRLHAWSSKVGEIKVGDDPHDPTVGIALSGVDVESVLDRAKTADSDGARRQKVRELLFAQLEIDDTRLPGHITTTFRWRGTTRTAEVRFGNVRDEQDLTDGGLRPSGDGWCVVLDFPFDDEGHTPSDDLARLESWLGRYQDGARTVVWIPSFFSSALKSDVGRLVVHEHALTGDGFRRYADHLSDTEQVSARRTLETQRDALRNRVALALRQAYGIARPTAELVDLSLLIEGGEAGHVRALWPGFEVRRPVGAGLREAAEHLLGQAHAHEHPAHPTFGREPKQRDLQRTLELLREAMQQEGGRFVVHDRTARQLLADLAQPMWFGQMAETAFVLGDRWTMWFEQKVAAHQGHPTVGEIREWLGTSDLQGVPKPAEDLAVIAIVEQHGWRFDEHGGFARPSVGSVRDDLVAMPQPMPPRPAWDAAVRRAHELLGLTPNIAFTAQAVGALATDLRERLRELADPVGRLPAELRARGVEQGSDRARTADELVGFVDGVLRHTDDLGMLAEFGTRELTASPTAAGVALTQAPALVDVLEREAWSTIDQLRVLADSGDAEAGALLEPLHEALRFDEQAAPLEPRLAAAAREGRLLIERRLRKPAPTPVPEPGTEPAGGGEVTVVGAERAHEEIDRLTRDADGELQFTIRWQPRAR
jgi:hypothetical protein